MEGTLGLNSWWEIHLSNGGSYKRRELATRVHRTLTVTSSGKYTWYQLMYSPHDLDFGERYTWPQLMMGGYAWLEQVVGGKSGLSGGHSECGYVDSEEVLTYLSGGGVR